MVTFGLNGVYSLLIGGDHNLLNENMQMQVFIFIFDCVPNIYCNLSSYKLTVDGYGNGNDGRRPTGRV